MRTPPELPESATDDERVRAFAAMMGFDLVGVARADVPLSVEHERYLSFVEQGLFGEMTWLAENREARRTLDSADMLEGARSVICLATSYHRRDDEGEAPPGSVASSMARYARGRDYHKGVRRRIRQVASFVRTLGGGVEARPVIDTAPLLERAWAARAGLGFVGKNGMLIAPGLGSYLLVGEVVTTLPLTAGTPIGDRCGACTRCLDACPTQAFVRPFVLDAGKCISYLTIELEGPMPAPLRAQVGPWFFGCDVCNEVCPFNRTRPPPPQQTEFFAPLSRYRDMPLRALLDVDEAGWQALCEGSPTRRLSHASMLRNALVAVANSGDSLALPSIDRIASSHPDPWVREHASWARLRLVTP